MGVSKNRGTSKSSILIGFSTINYKPSILGYPYFWKHPHGSQRQPIKKSTINHPSNPKFFNSMTQKMSTSQTKGPNLKLSEIRRNWTRKSPTPPSSCQGFSCFFSPVASGMEIAQSQLEIWDRRNELTLQIG